MIIKKIGYLLLIRLKLFSILAKLAPLVIVASFFLIYFTSHLKQNNEMQEPSLRTKLQNVRTFKSSFPLNYTSIYQGINFIQIPGALQHECMLLTFPQEHEQSGEIKNIYQTLAKGAYNPKNIVFLSYQSPQALEQFFSWYYNPEKNIRFSLGIIRVGLNIDFSSQKGTMKDGHNGTKNKAYFDIYSPELHVDLDYYSAINQLLAVTLFATSPCRQLHREPFRSIRKGFLGIARYLGGKDELKLFAEHAICEFQHHVNHSLTAHEIMMRNGFQAGSVHFLVGDSSTKKAEQVVVSFMREFGLQEDHLHSASDFYYIISRTEHLPLLGFMISSIIFTIGASICNLNRFIVNAKTMTLQIPGPLLLICLAWLWEESLNNTNLLTVIVAIGCLGGAACKELYDLTANKIKSVQYTSAQLIITTISALISLFFGLLCYSLSIVAMLTTTLLFLKPRQTVLRVGFKLVVLAVILMAMLRLQESDQFGLSLEVFQGLAKLSKRMGVILIVMLLGLSM